MTGAPAVVSRSVRHGLTLDRVLLGLLAVALLVALAVLCIGVFQPLLEFSFRQTQTALTSYWLLRGGPIFAYETPVVGFPWSLPFEFPLYQLIAAALSSAGVPLDAAGRIVSFVFFVGCLWPMHVLFRAVRLDALAFFCVAIPFLLCPLYLFWGRTFMVETCALFFCFLWLAYLARFLAEPKVAFAAIAAITGSLGILAKSTTFPGFAVLGGLLFLAECYAAWTSRAIAARARPILPALFVIATPLLIGGAWTVYSDTVKARNEFGAYLISTVLPKWVFGALHERLDVALWKDIIWKRALTDVFGYAVIPALALIAASLIRRRYAYAALAAALAFLIPFLVFTNLHMVHSYYQTANAVFIVAAAGLGIASVMSSGYPVSGIVALTIVAAGQLGYFNSTYATFLTQDLSGYQVFRIANAARAATPPAASLIVIGDDWSSLVPYYAQRKSFVIPNRLPLAFWQRILATPQNFLGDARLGGVVYCADLAPTDPQRKILIDAFMAGRAVLEEAGRCRLLAPDKQ